MSPFFSEFFGGTRFRESEKRSIDFSATPVNAYQEWGNNKESTAAFMQTFVQNTENIVFDTTHLVSQPNKMQLNQKGYHSTGSYDPQVNLLHMFATDPQLPAYYRIFSGNVHGMSGLKIAIKGAGVKNACVVGDKGFSSEANINMLDEA